MQPFSWGWARAKAAFLKKPGDFNPSQNTPNLDQSSGLRLKIIHTYIYKYIWNPNQKGLAMPSKSHGDTANLWWRWCFPGIEWIYMNLQQPMKFLEMVIESLDRPDLLITPAHGQPIHVYTPELLGLARKQYPSNSQVYIWSTDLQSSPSVLLCVAAAKRASRALHISDIHTVWVTIAGAQNRPGDPIPFMGKRRWCLQKDLQLPSLKSISFNTCPTV